MSIMHPGLRETALGLILSAGGALHGAWAAGIDWAKVPGKEIVLFYPGQASWEWSLTGSDMSGADDLRKKKVCSDCHIGEEKTMGPHIVTGTPRVFKTETKPSIEPAPIPGKPGSFPATIKIANDGTDLLIHLEFKEGSQPDAKQDDRHATTVTVMFEGGKVPEANRGGGFAACHDDSAGMASAGDSTRTMYLPKTRAKMTRQGGGDTLKAADDLMKLRADGYQLEFWKAMLNPGKPAETATELVFDARTEVTPNIVSAQASQSGDTWSVTISRKLVVPPPFTSIVPGETYYIAIAIHAGHTAHRFHYASFERSLTIDGGSGDLVAMKR